MQWREFAAQIRLPEEAIRQIEQAGLTDEKYKNIKFIYDRDHELFFEKALKRPDAPLHFLAVYCRMACDTYDRYRECKVDEAIFWDTFQDIRFWCENYKNEYGSYGIGAFDWFWRHIDMTLFRLGRLQFEQMKMEYAVGKDADFLPQGSEVINIHIPQGEKLDMTACQESLERAYARYGKKHPYVCHSWLLYPGLKKVLKETSNILQFQKLFRIIQVDYKEREAEWRIFGKVKNVIAKYPEDTSLQRGVKEYLLKGNTLGNGWGILN